jgi:hypothetical protein
MLIGGLLKVIVYRPGKVRSMLNRATLALLAASLTYDAGTAGGVAG